MVDAVRDRLADGDVRAREQRDLLSQFLEHRFACGRSFISRSHVDLGGLDSLNVLVQFRAPGSPCRGRHFRHAEHQPLERIAERVRIREARARNRHGADGQGAFVELRQKRLPAATMPTSAATSRATAAVRTVRQYVIAWPSQRSVTQP